MLKAVRMLMLRVAWALAGAAICCFLIIFIHSRFIRDGKCVFIINMPHVLFSSETRNCRVTLGWLPGDS